MSDNENNAWRIIMNHLAQNEEISNSQAVKLLGKSEATVRRYLAKFVELELLEYIGDRKTRKYLMKRK